MVSPFQQPPAVGDMRRARRKQLAQELAQGLQTGVGGLDMLEDAKRRAGLDKERQQDRATKQQAADLDRKTQEAQLSDLLARARRRAVTDAQADEDRMLEKTLDEQERLKADRLEREAAEKAKDAEVGEESADLLARALATASVNRQAEATEPGASPESALVPKQEWDEQDLMRRRAFAAKNPSLVPDEEWAKLGLGPKPRPAGPRQKSKTEELREQKLQAEIDALKTRGTDEGKPLATGEAMAIAELDGLLGNTANVRAQKGNIDTGPVAGRVGILRSKVGLGNPDVTRFRADVGAGVADYIKGMSGAAASDAERAFLTENVPTVNDNDEEFAAKLDRVEQWAQRKKDSLLKVYGQAGRNVSKFTPEPADRVEAAKVIEDENALIDQLMDEHPEWTDEEIDAEIERRKRG